MSTRFFTNSGSNTLLAKLEGVFRHNPDILQFDALVAYLKPAAQEQLLATPSACLAVIELAVNWETEKLYGVEGLGPFDEF